MHSATNLWKFHKSVALYYLYCSFLVYIRGFLLVFCLFVLAYVLVDGGDLIFNSCPHAKTSSFSPVEPTQAIIQLPDPQTLVLPSPCMATCQFLVVSIGCGHRGTVVAVSLFYFQYKQHCCGPDFRKGNNSNI